MATATYRMGMTQQCNSTNSTCKFSKLQCGQTYEFSVTAYSNMCYSEVSTTVETQTGKLLLFTTNHINRFLMFLLTFALVATIVLKGSLKQLNI